MHQRTSNSFLRHVRNHQGFTLIELSIVLVIISLIVGGVTVGNRLYQNSKLMTIVAETEEMRSYMLSFKDKYSYLPGDFPNATTLWPAMSGTEACDDTGNASNNQTSLIPVAATCNGRGNGKIGSTFTDGAQFSNASNTDLRELRESFYAWQHLALAGFIDGTFSGYSTDSSSNHFMWPGINVPQSEFSPFTGFMIEHWDIRYSTSDPTNASPIQGSLNHLFSWAHPGIGVNSEDLINANEAHKFCLLYTSPSPRDLSTSRMPSSA